MPSKEPSVIPYIDKIYLVKRRGPKGRRKNRFFTLKSAPFSPRRLEEESSADCLFPSLKIEINLLTRAFSTFRKFKLPP